MTNDTHDSRPDAQPSTTPTTTDATFDELVAFLGSTGAGEVDHTGGADLLHHLVSTYDVLATWGCPEYLCRAGLFHSVYGTEFFDQTTIPLSERDRIRGAIGEDAERIAFFWGIVVRDSIYENRGYIISREDGSQIPITRQDLADLWTLDLANILEVYTRYELTEEERRKSLALYGRGLEFLPPAAIAAMQQTFGVAA